MLVVDQRRQRRACVSRVRWASTLFALRMSDSGSASRVHRGRSASIASMPTLRWPEGSSLTHASALITATTSVRRGFVVISQGEVSCRDRSACRCRRFALALIMAACRTGSPSLITITTSRSLSEQQVVHGSSLTFLVDQSPFARAQPAGATRFQFHARPQVPGLTYHLCEIER